MVKFSLVLVGKKEVKRIYLRYRPNRELDIKIKTPYSINSESWDSQTQCWNVKEIVRGAKTANVKKKNLEIETFNNLLTAFRSDVSNLIMQNLNLSGTDLTKLLNTHILNNYFGYKIEEEKNKAVPEKFSDLIDFYISFRSVRDKTQDKHPLAENTIKKLQGMKKVLQNFDKDLKVTEINNLFRVRLVRWLDSDMQYSEQNQAKILKDIKTLCLFAETEHIISPDVKRWKIKDSTEIENASKGIYFTFEQIRILKGLNLAESEKLDNARDWLLISVFTAVRVSELMKMKSEDISTDDKGNEVIKVIEDKNRNKKGGGLKYLPLLDDVKIILEKRGGEFPRPISSQKYNDYIKEVCKVAGFNEELESAIIQKTDKGNRKVKGVYPFYKLVTSHIGRQTFVTLFSRYLSLEVVQMMTNHQSEKMTAHYNKTDYDTQQKQKATMVLNAIKMIDFAEEQMN